MQQLVGGRLVSIESLWLGSSFTPATLPAAYPLRLAAFGVCGVAVVCAPTCGRAPGGPSLETNLCSSSRVSVSSFDGAARSSLGEGKGSLSMLERASVWIISSAGFLPVFDSLPVLLEAALVAILVPCRSGAYPQLAVLHS